MNVGLQFLHGFHTAHCRAVVDKYFVGYWSLQYIEQGELDLRYDQAEHKVTPGTFWPCMPGPHVYFTVCKPGASWNHRYVAVTGRRVEGWAREGLLDARPTVVPASRRGEFARRMDDLIHLFRRDHGQGVRRGANLLENLLLEIAELRAGGCESPLAARVLTVLVAAQYGPVDYEAFARELRCSVPTLRRRFVLETGQPIHQFVQHARIERVKRLLIETEYSIKHIAEVSGFRDVFYLSRQFKVWTGLSPARFRETRAV